MLGWDGRNWNRAVAEYAKLGYKLQAMVGQVRRQVPGADNVEQVRAYYSPSTKTITVQVDHPTLTWNQLLDHEETHRLIKEDAAYKKAVQEALLADEKLKPYLADILRRYNEKYNEVDPNMTADEVAEEMLADYRAGFDMLDPLGTLAGVQKAPKTAARDIRALERKGVAPTENGESAAKTNGSGEYSIDPGLPNRLNQVLADAFPKSTSEVHIGETSNFLVSTIGADSLSVTMPADKAYAAMVSKERAIREGRYDENLNYHDLGENGLVEVLTRSEDPVIAFVDTPGPDKKRSDRIVLVTDYLKNGAPVLVVEQMDTSAILNGKRRQVNKTITTYDRSRIAADIIDAWRQNRLLHYDKKRSQNMLAGVQGANSLAAIQDTDFRKNIADFWAGVKWEKSGADSVTAEPKQKIKTPTELAWDEAQAKAAAKMNTGGMASTEIPYNRTAILTEDTVDRWLKDYASASSPKYAQAYITRMSPGQFLKLTTSRTGRRSLRQGPRGSGLGRSRQPFREEVVGYLKKSLPENASASSFRDQSADWSWESVPQYRGKRIATAPCGASFRARGPAAQRWARATSQ